VSHLLLVLVGLLSISMALGQTTDERYPIYNKEGKVGFIDAQGNEVIAPQFMTVADMAHFREGLAPVMVKEGGGYIDINGHFVIGPNPDFGQPRPFHEGFATLLIWGKNGTRNTVAMIDRQGNIVKSDVVESPSFSEGLLAFAEKGKWGFVDKTFRWVIPAQYDYAGDFSDGMAPVRTGRRYGYVDKRGNEIVPPKYALGWSFSDGLGRVKLELPTGEMVNTVEGPRERFLEQYGFVDIKGHEVITPQFEYATNFQHGLAFAIAPGSRRWGIIDKQGRFVQEPIYDQAGEFHDDRAPVRVGDKWGFVGPDGELIIAPQFAGANEFWNGLARVSWDDGYGYIDTSGATVWRLTNPPSQPRAAK